MPDVEVVAYPAIKRLPKAAVAVSLHPTKSVALVASDDRSLRTFDLGTGRPVGAVVSLPAEVGAIVVDLSPGPDPGAEADDGWGSVWIACGAEVHQLRLGPTPFLRPFAAARVRSVILGSGKSEVNDLALGSDGRSLGWCTDDGKVGVFDLTTGTKTAMKGKHANLAGSVAFLPSHPATVLSTGYDSEARTWSAGTGVGIESLALDPPQGSSTTMAPTFPLSLAVCSLPSKGTDINDSAVAIGTADGALWLAFPPPAPSPVLPPDGAGPPAPAKPLSKEQKKAAKRRASGPWRVLGRLERVALEGAGVEGSFVVGVALIPRSSPSAPATAADTPFPLILTLSHTGSLRLWSASRRPTHPSSPTSAGVADGRQGRAIDLSLIERWETSRGLTKCNALAVAVGPSYDSSQASAGTPAAGAADDAKVNAAAAAADDDDGDCSRPTSGEAYTVVVGGFDGRSGAGAVEAWRVSTFLDG